MVQKIELINLCALHCTIYAHICIKNSGWYIYSGNVLGMLCLSDDVMTKHESGHLLNNSWPQCHNISTVFLQNSACVCPREAVWQSSLVTNVVWAHLGSQCFTHHHPICACRRSSSSSSRWVHGGSRLVGAEAEVERGALEEAPWSRQRSGVSSTSINTAILGWRLHLVESHSLPAIQGTETQLLSCLEEL